LGKQRKLNEWAFTVVLCYCNGNLSCYPLNLQMLDQRLHSATHSLQATPNSTIHSLPSRTHPPLVDLWGTVGTETYQADMMGYMSMPVTVDGNLAVPTEEVTTDHSPLLEAQEEEIKVSGKEVKWPLNDTYATLKHI